jgi:hypothetical protein
MFRTHSLAPLMAITIVLGAAPALQAQIASTDSKLTAGELPRLAKELDPKAQYSPEQKKLPDLPEAYFSTSPEDLGDGLQVGTLDIPGASEAVTALVADDEAGKYSNLDSILLWKDGKSMGVIELENLEKELVREINLLTSKGRH